MSPIGIPELLTLALQAIIVGVLLLVIVGVPIGVIFLVLKAMKKRAE
jgi:hypothetical protein